MKRSSYAIIAGLAALAAGLDVPMIPASAAPQPSFDVPVPKYPPAQQGDSLEVVEVFSAPPSIRTTRRFTGDLAGRPAICWIGTALRSHGFDAKGEIVQPTKVVYVKVIAPTRDYRDGVDDTGLYGAGKREETRRRKRELQRLTGSRTVTLREFEEWERQQENYGN